MRDRRNTSLSISSTSSSNSSTSSSSMSEKPLLSPTPPSPTLPAPVTKENHSRLNARKRPQMALRILAVVCAVLVLWRIYYWPRVPLTMRFAVDSDSRSDGELSMGNSSLDEPRALLVHDSRGYSRWTVSIPTHHSFPLRGKYYQDICRDGSTLRDTITHESQFMRSNEWRRKQSYYSIDRTFLEVDKAESIWAVPNTMKPDGNICEKSLTFVLDAEDASFAKSILMLWMSYGIAKKEKRAFFIDDTRWAYGRYTSFFAPPPSPECKQPPWPHIVPCPHSANHLLVSSATMQWTFGAAFERQFIQSRKHGIEKSREMYDLLRTGYENLFVMTGEDALYASSRLARFKEEAHQHSGSVVGLHIRRGDLHPLEYQYSQDYLPVDRYASAAHKMLRSRLQIPLLGTTTDADDFNTVSKYVHSPLLLASDDPEMFESTELREGTSPFAIHKAQERIQLATKTALDLASPAQDLTEPGSAYTKHVDENSGWEGGFFSSLFFAIGKSRSGSGSSIEHEDDDDCLPRETLRMRELVGRAYLLDLSILGESDGVVCAVSSASCRVLAVMLGWEAVKNGRWMNVDDGRPWSWDGRQLS